MQAVSGATDLDPNGTVNALIEKTTKTVGNTQELLDEIDTFLFQGQKNTDEEDAKKAPAIIVLIPVLLL